jgi:hypothetical protein
MDGDLGGVDIVSGKEEATNGKSFLFQKKKKKGEKASMHKLLGVKKIKIKEKGAKSNVWLG